MSLNATYLSLNTVASLYLQTGIKLAFTFYDRITFFVLILTVASLKT